MQKSKIKMFGTALLAVCAIMLTVVSALVFSACGTMYRSNPGTLEQMAGTYRLTTYTQLDDDGNDVNRVEQWHVQAYLVVGTDGHGYYAYQDDNTDFWYDTILIQYGRDSENQDLYKSIQFTKGVSDTRISYQKPGYGYEPVMGFNANNLTFNYTISNDPHPRKGIYPSYYTDVIYTKISNNTDLTTVAAETKRDLAPLAMYELKNLNGVLVYYAGMPNNEIAPDVTNPQYNKYKYYVVDFNALNKTANIYYELVEGENGQQVEENVKIDVALTTKVTGENSTLTTLSLKFFDEEYSATVNFGSAPNRLYHIVNTEPDEFGTSTEIYNNWFRKYTGDKTTLDEIIAEELEHYADGTQMYY